MPTIIYYSAHLESENFERRIRKTLARNGRTLPMISVTQNPVGIGKNICVGEMGVSSQNAYRQLQTGALVAKTKYICTAESDFLYPEEYFRFKPRRDDVAYYADPLYVLHNQRGYAKVFNLKPRGSEGAMFVNRLFLIEAIEKLLKNFGFWGMADASQLPYYLFQRPYKVRRFKLSKPVITFKTERQMHKRTPHDPTVKSRELPYWGKSHDLIRRYQG